MIPRTLDALRVAVARVLVARGEAPDALTITTEPCGWSPWHPDDERVTIAVVVDCPAFHAERRGRDVAHAVERLWSHVLDVVFGRAVDTRHARKVAERRGDDALSLAVLRAEESRAANALTAARAVEAGE